MRLLPRESVSVCLLCPLSLLFALLGVRLLAFSQHLFVIDSKKRRAARGREPQMPKKQFARRAFLLLAFLLCVCLARPDFIYSVDGREERAALTQLWYEGYWKEVRKSSFLGRPCRHDLLSPFSPLLPPLTC